MLSELGERLAVFGLALHEQKTRLIEFGRFAATSRSHRGERRPETFAFLGFTHYCGWTRARQVHRRAQDREQAPDAQAEGAAQGGVAADARHRWPPSIAGTQPCWSAITATTDAPTTTARSPASAAQFPARSPTHLVHVPQAPQPEEPEDVVERVRCPDVQLHPAGPPDHATMDATPGMTRVTFRRSRVRESRTPGSVRAKPNGRATRP